MNKLFKKWKKEFDSFWDKLPKSGRALLGIVFSFIITMISLKIWIVPQREKIESLAKKAPPSNEVISTPDRDLDVMEARILAKNLSKQLAPLKKQVADLKSGAPYLKPEYSAEVLLSIDKLAADSGLNIHSRVDFATLDKNTKVPKARRGRGAKKSVEPNETNEGGSHFIYKYEMVGDFKNIYAFFYRLKKINGYFDIEDISIQRFDGKGSNEVSGLIIKFNVRIYYL